MFITGVIGFCCCLGIPRDPLPFLALSLDTFHIHGIII